MHEPQWSGALFWSALESKNLIKLAGQSPAWRRGADEMTSATWHCEAGSLNCFLERPNVHTHPDGGGKWGASGEGGLRRGWELGYCGGGALAPLLG